MEELIHERGEFTPPHGDAIRFDVRRPTGARPKSAIAVVHGFKGFKDWGFFPHVCERLAEAGHLVVSFNGSLCGIGSDLMTFDDLDAFGRNTFSREVDDLKWVLEQLAQGAFSQGGSPERIGVLGHSRGGGAAILAAAESGRVDSLVTWAAISTFDRWTPSQIRDWETTGVTYVRNGRTGQDMPLERGLWDDYVEGKNRLAIVAAAKRLESPWLIVHGSEDESVPVEEAYQLGEASDATVVIIAGASHTFGAGHPMTSMPAALDGAISASANHFQASLMTPR